MSLTKKIIDLPSEPWCSTFSVDGNSIYFGLGNGDILVVDVNSLKVVNTVNKAHIQNINDIACSKDGNHIATASDDKTIKIWNTSSFECVRTLTGHTSSARCCAFSPKNNNVLISGSYDKSVKVWNISSGQCENTIHEHTNYVSKCKFSHSGLLFASCSFDNTIKLWNASTYACVATFNGHVKGVNNFLFTHNNKYIVSVSYDKSIRVWSLQSFECVKTIQNVHHRDIYEICQTTNKYIFTGSTDNTIKVWNIETWHCVETVQSIIITNMSCNQNCSLLCVTSYSVSQVEIWSNTKYDVVLSVQQPVNQNADLIQEIQDLKNKLSIITSENTLLKEQIQNLVTVNQKSSETIGSNDLSCEIDFNHFKINEIEVLGEGSFGTVYKGMYYKLPVAVKKLRTKHTKQSLDDFNNEIQTLLKLKHSHIVSCFGCSFGTYPLVILELMSQSLHDWILSQEDSINMSTIDRICYEIALGMHYLHSFKPMIIHRDLKSLNILLDSDLHAKISDFGLAKTKSHSQSNTNVNTLGSILWAAPEYLTVKRIKDRNEKGDVYSFGVIVWELITRKIPWKEEGYNSEDIKEVVTSGERLQIPKTCPEHLKEVMNQCWNDNTAKRPSFDVLINVLSDGMEKKPLIQKKATSTEGLTTEEDLELARLKKELQKKKKALNL